MSGARFGASCTRGRSAQLAAVRRRPGATDFEMRVGIRVSRAFRRGVLLLPDIAHSLG